MVRSAGTQPADDVNPAVVEAMAEATRQTSKPALVLENVRRRLSSQICQGLADGQGFVPVITLSPSWEAEFIEAVKIVGEDRTFVMSPKRVQEFVLQARQQIQRFASEDSWPALMVNPEARSYVRSMLERVSCPSRISSRMFSIWPSLHFVRKFSTFSLPR